MTRIAWLQCHSGISGDMLLGALVDLGVEPAFLEEQLRRIDLPPFRLEAGEVERKGIRARKITPRFDGTAKSFATLGQIQELLRRGRLRGGVVREAERVFIRLAEAEAAVHGKTAGTVHFHELGSPDTVVDVVGTIIAWRELGIGEAFATAVNLGGGTVRSAHGTFPVPAPATARLMEGWPVYSDGEEGEKTTPTGAALLTHLAVPAGVIPPMRLEKSGRGAGDREFASRANHLQILLGERDAELEGEEAVVMETNIDDVNPQILGYLTAKLLKEGAMESFITPVIMKKGRPGHLLTVVAPPEKEEALGAVIFRETATLGYRSRRVGRVRLQREVREVRTSLGPVRVKTASFGESRSGARRSTKTAAASPSSAGVRCARSWRRFSVRWRKNGRTEKERDVPAA